MSPASIIAALQREDGQTLRRLFGPGFAEDETMEVIDALVSNGNITELDGRYYLRHSKLPPAEISPDPAPPPSPRTPPPAAPATTPEPPPKRGVPAGLRNTPETRARAMAEREAVLGVLESADTFLRVYQIAEISGVPERSVATRLKSLEKAGKARKVGQAWRAAQASEPLAPPAAREPARELRPVEPRAPAGSPTPRSWQHLHPALRALIDELPPAGQDWPGKDAFVVALTGVVDFLYPDCADGG